MDTFASSDVNISHEEEVGCETSSSQTVPNETRFNAGQHMRLSQADSAKFPVNKEVVESMDGIEDGEALDFCVVCGQLEPPELSCQPNPNQTNSNELQVIDWAHCDYCNHWVHLNSCCSEGAVIGDNSFMCVVCRNSGIGENIKNLHEETESPEKTEETEQSTSDKS
ncbi:unnamed protein product [Trichobilharzia regenti]|nr:unnamed protein product [Trichobilharzia regenti]